MEGNRFLESKKLDSRVISSLRVLLPYGRKGSKVRAYQFTYAGLLHGYAVYYIYGSHDGFVVRNDNKLRVVSSS